MRTLFLGALTALITVLCGCTTTHEQPQPVTEQPTEEPKQLDPLMASNAELRAFFIEGRKAAVVNETFVLAGTDDLYFYRKGERSTVRYTPELYHTLKAVCHAPLATFGLFAALGEGPYSGVTVTRLSGYRARVADANATIGNQHFSDAQLNRSKTIMAATLALIDRAIADKALGHEDLQAFCGSLSKPLLDHAYDASQAQLGGLNDAMTTWLATLTPEEKGSYHVVVALSHQAREANLQAEYFRALIGEDGPDERRVVLAEGVFSEEGLLSLLGTHLLDGTASQAFFGDELRLQRDLLGDAARQIIPTLTLPK